MFPGNPHLRRRPAPPPNNPPQQAQANQPRQNFWPPPNVPNNNMARAPPVLQSYAQRFQHIQSQKLIPELKILIKFFHLCVICSDC